MSHFTVSLIVQGCERRELEERVEAMLLPYMEEGVGGLPEKYLEFRDMEAEYLKEYETETSSRVQLEDGTTVSLYDKQFEVKYREPGMPWDSTKYVVPEHLKQVEVPHNQLYATLDEFCDCYHGLKRDPKTGRQGYWHNPQGFWDWYVIGGRWKGLLRTKDGLEQDIARFKHLDFEWAAGRERDERETTLKRLRAFYAHGMKDPDATNPWDSVRYTLIKIGALDCASESEIPALEAKYGPIPEKRRYRWDRSDHNGEARYDLFVIDPEIVDMQWFESHDGGYFHPFHTYAMLDEGGWHQPGKMGWFASSSATPDSREDFGVYFTARLKRAVEETPDAYFVVVDCHV